MKKLLITSATLFLFSASILMFQISCSKDANAGTNGGAGTLTQGKVLILKNSTSPFQFSLIDKNGVETIISPVIPAPFESINKYKYTTDGSIIFFEAFNTSGTSSLFSCDINGSNVKNLNKNVSGYNGNVISIF